MDKIRITITTVIEYEPKVNSYPGVSSIEGMAQLDFEAAKEDPMEFMGMRGAETEVTMNIIKDEKND